MRWTIVGPTGHRPASPDPNTYGPSDLQRVKAAANTALYKLDAYLQAADARRRAGSWNPDAARTNTDRDALNYLSILRGEHRNTGNPTAIECHTGGRVLEVR